MSELRLPDYRTHAVGLPNPGAVKANAIDVLGTYLDAVRKQNLGASLVYEFGPDEVTAYQHTRWLHVSHDLASRARLTTAVPPSGILLLSSDNLAQDSSFLDMLVQGNPSIVRAYLPPDANTLLGVTDHCLRSRGYLIVIVAGNRPAPQWLTMDEAIRHWTAGIGIWDWASNDQDDDPDVVMAAAGEVVTREVLAAITILRDHLPDLKIRMINVVDLMRLPPAIEHPHGMSDRDFDALFTRDKPIIFAFQGPPGVIERLTCRRTNFPNLHVCGSRSLFESVTPAITSFDLVERDRLDRFALVEKTIATLPHLGVRARFLREDCANSRIDARQYVARHGEDTPEVRDWRWGKTEDGDGGMSHGVIDAGVPTPTQQGVEKNRLCLPVVLTASASPRLDKALPPPDSPRLLIPGDPASIPAVGKTRFERDFAVAYANLQKFLAGPQAETWKDRLLAFHLVATKASLNAASADVPQQFRGGKFANVDHSGVASRIETLGNRIGHALTITTKTFPRKTRLTEAGEALKEWLAAHPEILA